MEEAWETVSRSHQSGVDQYQLEYQCGHRQAADFGLESFPLLNLVSLVPGCCLRQEGAGSINSHIG